MQKRIRITEVLLTFVVALLAGIASGDEDATPKTSFKIHGRPYSVSKAWDVLSTVRQEPEYDRSWPSTFFVHAMGPTDGHYFAEEQEEHRWSIVRVFPRRGGESLISYGPRGYAVVFGRPFTKDWRLTAAPVTDWALSRVEKVQQERVSLLIVNKPKGHTPKQQEQAFRNLSFCAVPDGSEDPAYDAVYFKGDLWSAFAHHNLRIDVYPNFSDLAGLDYKESTAIPIPVRMAVAVRDFLDQPFPEAGKILHARSGRLIGQFALDAEEVKVGKPVKVVLTFGIDALSMSEMVRLKASNGGFQRQGKDIVYRPDKKGTHKLVVEAFCGFHWDGRIDYAERREIEVVVGE